MLFLPESLSSAFVEFFVFLLLQSSSGSRCYWRFSFSCSSPAGTGALSHHGRDHPWCDFVLFWLLFLLNLFSTFTLELPVSVCGVQSPHVTANTENKTKPCFLVPKFTVLLEFPLYLIQNRLISQTWIYLKTWPSTVTTLSSPGLWAAVTAKWIFILDIYHFQQHSH